MLTSCDLESTLSHIILPCSLQPLPLQFSIAPIKIVAKNKAVLSIAKRRTSPRLQHAAARARGGSSSQGLLSGGTTESRRGGGTNANTAPTPSRRLPFASVGWETPIGTYSVSSMSASRCSSTAVPTDPPAAKRAKMTPNNTEGKGSSFYDADDGGDKYDNEEDFIPATDGPIQRDAVDDMFIAEKAAELIDKHRQEFMKRAFSVRTLAADAPLTTASAIIKMCRPQEDIDYHLCPQELACGCQY
jgi:hypothetical protein